MEHTDILKAEENKQIFIRAKRSENSLNTYILTFFFTFICPCVANIFSEYNQQEKTFLNLFISVKRSTCFRRFFHPSSGAQNCMYSVGICQAVTATCC